MHRRNGVTTKDEGCGTGRLVFCAEDREQSQVADATAKKVTVSGVSRTEGGEDGEERMETTIVGWRAHLGWP
eukprot:1824253-Pleurochrysis_carterae.AAC.1